MASAIVAFPDPSIRKMLFEILDLEGYAVRTTDNAAGAYEHLCTSPEPALAFIGTRLGEGTILDVLRAVAQDAGLQRHRYIEIADHDCWPEPERSELKALFRRLSVEHLPLPFTVDQLLDLVEGKGRP